MKRLAAFLLAYCSFASSVHSQTLQAAYGTAVAESGFALQLTSDGGYAMAGARIRTGAFQFWLLKLTSTGVISWSRTYGGSSEEQAYSMVQTADGGYILAGYTETYGAGGRDIFIVKTDATGAVSWSRTYGGPMDERAYAIRQADDGGYYIAGGTGSFSAGVDIFVMKIDGAGAITWTSVYTGSQGEAYALEKVSGGRMVVSGYTYAYGAGECDAFMFVINDAGALQYGRAFGGVFCEHGMHAIETADGGFAYLGHTYTWGMGASDYFLVRTDASANMLWSKTYGAAAHDYGFKQHVREMPGGGFTLLGSSLSFGGANNLYLVRVDAAGNHLWSRTYGSTTDDYGYGLLLTGSGFAIVGETYGFGTGTPSGDGNAYFILTDPSGFSGCNESVPATVVTTPAAVQTNITPAFVGGFATASPGAGIQSPAIDNVTMCSVLHFEMNDASQWIEEGRDELYVSEGYPSPASEGVSFELFLPEENTIHLRLLDAHGRIMYEQHTEPATGGIKLGIDVSSFPSGIYFAEFVNDGSRFSRRLAVIR